MTYSIGDTIVIEKERDSHNFETGDRVIVIQVFQMDKKYKVEDKNYKEGMVYEEDVRQYDSIDEYDDMYCDTCGGTACLC